MTLIVGKKKKLSNKTLSFVKSLFKEVKIAKKNKKEKKKKSNILHNKM